jgi:hypothetical protein
MLGVQYLWIDKLCIIQQDADDWAREGSKMAQIFEGSFLTIGAAISRGDTDSLFFQDKKHAPSLKSHVGQMKDGSSYTIHSRLPFRYHPNDGTSSQNDSEGYPLMTRAWAYQERLLAPRTLYFGEELSWECREASTCECSGASQGIKFDHSLSLLPGTSKGKLYLQWQETVQDYTWLQLSHEEDRLPAMSGLAQQYRYRLNSAYLAGLWRENLVADLMWYAHPEFGSEAQRYYTKRPRKWRAPSWSWASVEGPILFIQPWHAAITEKDTRVVSFWIEVIFAECAPSSLDPMGTVATGSLVIKGSGQLARLKHRESCTGHVTRHFSVTHTGVNSLFIHSNFTVDREHAHVDYDLIEHGLMNANSDLSIFCLYMGGTCVTQQIPRLDQGDYIPQTFFRTWSLLLYCVEGNIYERVGLLVIDHFDSDETQIRDGLDDCMITIV